MAEPAECVERLRAAVAAAQAPGFARVRFASVAEQRANGSQVSPMDGVGVVDFRAWRCVVDFGAYAQVFKDARLWTGASGFALSEFGDPATPWSPTPLTFIAFAEAATDATEVGSEVVLDEECVRFQAVADLDRLSSSHRPLPMPTEVLPDPRAVPFEAFLNEMGALRRLRWQSAYQALAPDWRTWDELDLLKLVDSIEIDWTRTPVYKPVEDDDLPPE